MLLLMLVLTVAVITPPEMQKLMGLGINMGNRIDLYQQPARPVNESFFEAYASAGFKNARIPVCWDERTGTAPPYTIEPDFLDLVEKAVGWSLSHGLVTVLNTHHEKWLDNPSAFEKELPRLEAIWTQLSQRFASHNETLLFEIFNEPHLMTASQLNEMNKAILPIIRKSNPTRIVVLMGLKFGNPSWLINEPSALDLPNDPQIMLEIHNYDPFKYAGGQPTDFSWGSAEDQAALSQWVDAIEAWSTQHRVPLYYGEFGCSNKQNASTGRDLWFQAHRRVIVQNGWAASVWNDGNGHLLYNYDTGEWQQDILKDLGL